MPFTHGAHLVMALNPLSSTSLLASLGALGVFLALFAETGLLIGFFLPGDSLLFTAGLLSATAAGSRAHLSLPVVILAAVAGALLGAQTGYFIGRTGGRRLLEHSRSRHLRQGAERAGQFLDRYGAGKAIVLARFIPVIRTVVNPMAGAVGVSARTFTIWQVAGGVLWAAGVTLAGYGLGSVIPGIDTYLLPAIAVIVIISFIPIGIELLRNRAAKRQSGGDSHEDPPGSADDLTGNAHGAGSASESRSRAASGNTSAPARRDT